MTAGVTQTDQRSQNRVKSDIAEHSYTVASVHCIKARGVALYSIEIRVVLLCDCDLVSGRQASTSRSPGYLQIPRETL